MGGEIGFTTEVAKGSTFWFHITLPAGSENRLRSLSEQLNGRRVLVIDDSMVHRTLARRYLERVGAVVEESESASDALEMLKTRAESDSAFQLVILDLRMPSMDGLQLARALREDERTRKLPVLIVGSDRDSAIAEEARALNIPGFLVKPVRRAFFLEAAARAIGANQADDGTSAAATTTEVVHPPTAGMRVLLVEDNPANQKVALLILGRFGCHTDLAENGLQALAAFTRNRYDLILMDCQMPEMDGFTATAEIRRQEAGSHHTPIVALTANALDEEKQKCLEAGMDDHLPKPFRKSDLQTMLEKWSSAELREVPVSEE
jgi:CheY-like chemotaxis protein